MRRRILILFGRLIFGIVWIGSAVAIVVLATVVLEDGRDTWNVVRHVRWGGFDDVLSEDLVLLACVAAIAGAWFRITWVIGVVAACHRKGREPRGSNRLLTRLVMRFLILVPFVVDGMSPRVHALSTFEITQHSGESSNVLSKATGSRDILLSRDVLLVSIVVAVGVSWRLRQRRLAALRENESVEIDERGLEFESEVVRHGEDLALARLDLAVRSLVATGNCDIRWLVQHSSGVIHVELTQIHSRTAPWTRVSDRVLVLDAEVSLPELSRSSSGSHVRVPILLPVGTTRAGSIWINLDNVGSFFVEGRGTCADAVWNGLCQSLALSPLHTSVSLIGTMDNELIGSRQIVAANEMDARQLSATLESGESPAVLLLDQDTRRHLCTVSTSRLESEFGLVARDGSWFLLPLEQPILPTSCGEEDRATISNLIGTTSESITAAPSIITQHQEAVKHNETIESIIADISFIARVMGRPCVEHVDRGRVGFERSKSEELVIWLALHPHRRHRMAARTEMWNVPVKDSTFSNITADVRRSLTVIQRPPLDDQWLSVTHNDDLPLHPRIVTDVNVLECCFDHARKTPEVDGARVLMFGLDQVRGGPFEGSRYLWRDATGLATETAMLIVRASTLCAEMALEAGDIELLYRSTAKGLLAVPGHESLVSIRMRQHAANDDRASLTVEWESYCRSLANDDWGDAQPSPKMVDLWRSLSGRSR